MGWAVSKVATRLDAMSRHLVTEGQSYQPRIQLFGEYRNKQILAQMKSQGRTTRQLIAAVTIEKGSPVVRAWV